MGVDSSGGFACRSQYLHLSTGYSVSRQRCHCSVTASLEQGSNGILTVSAIGGPVRVGLRSRLTLIR